MIIELSLEKEELELNFGEVTVVHEGFLPFYDGEYEVTPRKSEQILETENKSMKENVKINPITYSAVDNPFGGQTVTIGLE